MVLWMLSLDHRNYVWWLPIHVKDIVLLKQQVPSVYEEFENNNFVVQKSPHVFSTMAMDQAHEQMNGKIKGHGNVIRITDSPPAFIKWITAGSDVAQIIDEFETSSEKICSKATHHHDQSPSMISHSPWSVVLRSIEDCNISGNWEIHSQKSAVILLGWRLRRPWMKVQFPQTVQ